MRGAYRSRQSRQWPGWDARSLLEFSLTLFKNCYANLEKDTSFNEYDRWKCNAIVRRKPAEGLSTVKGVSPSIPFAQQKCVFSINIILNND